MADYDSDSSAGGDDIETNVLLGYASKEPTIDDFSQLGGLPTWLDAKTTAPGQLSKCKVCNGALSLLLQLNGDLPDRFPSHERRLYVLDCRRKPCRRKNGAIRAFRAVRASATPPAVEEPSGKSTTAADTKPPANIGASLFGAKSPTPAQANPFASSTFSTPNSNPFSSGQSASAQAMSSAQTAQVADLAETFAQKARISPPSQPPPPVVTAPPEPWSEDPNPYPSYHVDADKEYLDPTSQLEDVPRNARVETNGESSSAADDKALFESAMDKTFQRFADRLEQNPEQVLRYEFAGQPLLYSKGDAVGKLLSSDSQSKVQTASSRNGIAASSLSKVPRCASCGAARLFELQLTPHAITELEVEDTSVDGMDWGTVIVAVCKEDCQEKGKAVNEIGYVEEWVGVQWEEVAGKQPAVR
ncbi:hypothetical protein LTR37_003606 [Vermiconidia calcicola]|uniref:Uncharacterized protein n=1 Tax=Vermiconidia calcicola TaxID=1690605 RepID=A0ACC3NNZ2_9PEZI|nr:hypothetical protein LTR37_003606 [Vermiconidia calcicola]